MTYIYKVCSKKEWNDASEVGFYSGSEADINDGFIHLSTINQIQVTVSKHFAGQEDLLIIQFDEKKYKINLNVKHLGMGIFSLIITETYKLN